MTLGIGMRPSRENGVVLITDSFETCIDSNGEWSNVVDAKKLLWLVGTETAVAISGNVNDEELWRYGIEPNYRPLMPGLPQEPDPRDRVRRTFGAIKEMDAAVRARHPGEDRYDAMPDPGPHALFAVAEPSLLAKFTSKTQTWAQPGDVLTIGGWLIGMPSDLAMEMQLPAPETLADCKALATEWVTRYIDRVFGYRDPYQQIRETGTAPGVGGPLQVLTLTPEQSVREEIPITERSTP
ncbi:MAG: hypothetical protein M3082_06495 [Candidatus Dormibacteraeota bacterium]|nr:hypothetical protein [Candidatus Dormibacteraeota bacterium]